MEGLGMKKILVTGSEGYIGSVLMPMLKEKKYEIVGLDSSFFKDGILTNKVENRYPLITKDVRDIEKNDIEGFNVVIHLAALSNDPLGKINSSLTYDINHKASARLAQLSKDAGIKRFIFASSCSLYGASDKLLTEEDESNAQTAYGESKILAEKDISTLASSDFSPTFMRNATAFGISPRMRFDIVVNNLAGFAHTEKKIKILSDGKAWRPLVHVRDICDAMIFVIEANKEKIHNEAFNVGDNKENYQVLQIAQKIQKYYPDCEITTNAQNATDSRNYNVCFDKLNNQLGFVRKVSLNDGIQEIKNVYESIGLTKEIFEDKFFTRLKQIQYLLQNKKINKNLEWIQQ